MQVNEAMDVFHDQNLQRSDLAIIKVDSIKLYPKKVESKKIKYLSLKVYPVYNRAHKQTLIFDICSVTSTCGAMNLLNFKT